MHVKSAKNDLADSLSRLQFDRFAKLTNNLNMKKYAEKLPHELWPASKVWDGYRFDQVDI